MCVHDLFCLDSQCPNDIRERRTGKGAEQFSILGWSQPDGWELGIISGKEIITGGLSFAIFGNYMNKNIFSRLIKHLFMWM